VYPLAVGMIVESKEIWDELAQVMREMSLRIVFELTELPSSDWPGFLDRVERVRPDVILLEVTKLQQPLDQIMARIQSTPAQPAVYAVHREADPTAILTAMRAGAAEFLFPPLASPLKEALERLGQIRQRAYENQPRGGKAIGFLSVKGGCGATTLACHVAAELPKHTNTKVLLADLDLQSGMVGFLTKTKNPYSVSDAANNLERLDPSYWRALVSNGIPDLEIINAPSTPASRALSPQQLKQVVAFARTQYPWTILDLGRSLTAATLAVIDLTDLVYLVTTHEVPALRQVQQIRQTLVEGGFDVSKLRLVLNRLPKNSDITLEELEAMLGLPIDTTIPNQYHALQDAYAEGRLIDSSSTLGRSFTRLAMKLAGVTAKKKTFALFA
jgi:pilus assembly protein CpaE